MLHYFLPKRTDSDCRVPVRHRKGPLSQKSALIPNPNPKPNVLGLADLCDGGPPPIVARFTEDICF